jgi:hypothetical protein
MYRLILIFLLFQLACGSEEGAELARPSTFVRYYNGGYHDEAKLIKQTPDGGFIILSNGAAGQVPINPHGAKVIKIDVHGNPVWQSLFFPVDDEKTADIGRDLLILENGYLLLGASHIVLIDLEGKMVTQNSLNISGGFPSINFDGNTGTIAGASIAINPIPPNNYLVTGIRSSDKTMFLGELDKTTFKWIWLNSQGKANSIVTKLFLDANNLIYWTAPVTLGSEKITLLQVPQRNPPISAGSIGAINANQTPSDLSRYGNGFVISGTTTERNDNDICYYLLNQNAALSGDSRLIEVKENNGNEIEIKTTQSKGGGQVVFELNGAQTGNSISATQDGGIIILGTGNAADLPGYEKTGNGLEYILIKVDGFGDIEPGWPKYYGSKSDDEGVSVIQASDGSFMVLGTTTLAGIKTVFLMKTDNSGEIR